MMSLFGFFFKSNFISITFSLISH